MQALALHALYLSNAAKAQDGVVDIMEALMATSETSRNTSLQLMACHVFLSANDHTA